MALSDLAPVADPQAPDDSARRLRRAALLSAVFVALLWWIKLLEQTVFGPLTGLMLRPGEASGLIGVLTAPLLHGSIGHLLANSLPLLVLGTLALGMYPRASLRALPLIWLLSGIGVWFIARPSAHLGASGLTHGLMFFVFVLGLLRRDRPAIAGGLLTFFLYGGMLLTIFPREIGISWEYHLCGAAAGVLAALLWRRLDPSPPRKRYSWEDEDDETELQDPLAAADRAQFEPAPSADVPVLWKRETPPESRVIPFRSRREPATDD